MEGCPIPRSVQVQLGWGFEQPVKRKVSMAGVWNQMIFKVLSDAGQSDSISTDTGISLLLYHKVCITAEQSLSYQLNAFLYH